MKAILLGFTLVLLSFRFEVFVISVCSVPLTSFGSIFVFLIVVLFFFLGQVMIFAKADDFQNMAQSLEDFARRFKSKVLSLC